MASSPTRVRPKSRKYQHFIRDLHVGGVIVTGHSLNGGVRNAEPYAMARFAQPPAEDGQDAAVRRGRFRARCFHARELHHRVALQHGLCGREGFDGRYRGRRGYGSRRARHGRQLAVRAGGRRQQQPRQSHHQHPLVRRESGRSVQLRPSLHHRRAFGPQESRAGDGQTFSRPRRHHRR